MKILFYDVMQISDSPGLAALRSPALSETQLFTADSMAIDFSEDVVIDCVGIGNCEPGAEITVMESPGNACTVTYADDGLYPLQRKFTVRSITIKAPAGTTIGRLALGRAIDVPTLVVKEPGINSTVKSRRTLSGQVVPGAGGYFYRTLSLDSRHRLGREAIGEIERGFPHIGMGYPFFIDLSAESSKLTFNRLYAVERNQKSLGLSRSTMHELYSKRWDFRQVF